MNWRNPKKELPKDNETVWVMLEPHKFRGSLKDSAMSIQIVCGEVSHSTDGTQCRVENGDELGFGNISWYLKHESDDYCYDIDFAIAWLPLDEMPLPK